jgi:hypothetical protein
MYIAAHVGERPNNNAFFPKGYDLPNAYAMNFTWSPDFAGKWSAVVTWLDDFTAEDMERRRKWPGVE